MPRQVTFAVISPFLDLDEDPASLDLSNEPAPASQVPGSHQETQEDPPFDNPTVPDHQPSPANEQSGAKKSASSTAASPTPRTQAQREASRRNGAKSKGPVTPQGIHNSSQNAITHGLCAQDVVLNNESMEAYEHLLASYLTRFQPTDPVEHDLVEEMAAAQWRMRRARRLESALIDLETDRSAKDLEATFEDPDPEVVTAFVCERLAHHSALAQFQRQETRLAREYSRALKMLETLRTSKVLRPRDLPDEEMPGDSVPPHHEAQQASRLEEGVTNMQNEPEQIIENTATPPPRPQAKPGLLQPVFSDSPGPGDQMHQIPNPAPPPKVAA